MSHLLTFPSQYALEQACVSMPEFMRPSMVPYAVSLEGVLTVQECEEIQKTLTRLPPYHVKGCGAITREVEAAPCLDPIEQIARIVNSFYFNFDLDPGQHSWMQTYDGDVNRKADYHLHMDGSRGQTRKLTAVTILSDPREYTGGRLVMKVDPHEFSVPKTQGTVVIFQHWVLHEVEPVTSGVRRSINMGFWGPPFK